MRYYGYEVFEELFLRRLFFAVYYFNRNAKRLENSSKRLITEPCQPIFITYYYFRDSPLYN